MASPSEDRAADGPLPNRPAVRLSEASEARERRCADCGTMTSSWKPVRRKGTAILLCRDCAAKPATETPSPIACPACGAALTPGDAFCGTCGNRISVTCPSCGRATESADLFCGKCGARLGTGN